MVSVSAQDRYPHIEQTRETSSATGSAAGTVRRMVISISGNLSGFRPNSCLPRLICFPCNAGGSWGYILRDEARDLLVVNGL